MDEMQRYKIDVQGYIVLRGLLESECWALTASPRDAADAAARAAAL